MLYACMYEFVYLLCMFFVGYVSVFACVSVRLSICADVCVCICFQYYTNKNQMLSEQGRIRWKIRGIEGNHF